MSAQGATLDRPGRERPEWLQGTISRGLALLTAFGVALGIGSVICLFYGESPFAVYGAIVRFAFQDPTNFGSVLRLATPLIFSALAVSVCFKGGMFNIGVEGQYLVAMATATAAALYLDFLPGALLLIAVLAAGALGGMVYATVPAVLKVKTGAHEVVTTIMMNGIAVSLLAWALNGPLRYSQLPEGQNTDLRSDVFSSNALIPDIGRFVGVDREAHLSLLFPLAIVAAVLVWFVIRRTRLGYETRAMGSSPGAARAGGISVGQIQIKLFLISGALAGMVGMQQLLAERGALVQNYESQLGFTGIAVAFLGQNNPIGIIFAAILWGIMSRGEVALQIESEVPREFIIILQGILILSVVITYQVAKRRLAARQLQRAGAAGELEDSAGPDEDAGPRGPEITGREAFEGAGEGGV
jgi:general nucleoside transport system permease protein